MLANLSHPKAEDFSAAAANADWAKRAGFYMVLTDQPGTESWPICGATYILVYKEQKNLATATCGAQVLRLGLCQRRPDGGRPSFHPHAGQCSRARQEDVGFADSRRRTTSLERIVRYGRMDDLIWHRRSGIRRAAGQIALKERTRSLVARFGFSHRGRLGRYASVIHYRRPVWVLSYDSASVLRRDGLSFITQSRWAPDPAHNQFGALSSIFGTVVSSVIAMMIAAPLSLAIALFLVELAPRWLSAAVGTAIELLAAIPSIIFGMWGLFVLAPFMAHHVQPALQRWTGNFPLFTGPPMGLGMLTAGFVLSLMVLPFTTAISRDVFRMTPSVLRESAYAMGATTWEVTSQVTLRFGMRGILAAMFLGLSRALGETMAVTFVIGNSHHISASLFEPGTTISATIANEFTEATTPMYISALVALGLVLMVISLLVQIFAQLWLRHVARLAEGR